MITYNWIIESMQTKPVDGSNNDVVVTAFWRCNASQDTYSATAYGSASFPPPEGDFTPYDQLTQAQVLGWCYENGVDKAQVEASLDAQIQQQVNPPVVTLPLPWAA